MNSSAKVVDTTVVLDGPVKCSSTEHCAMLAYAIREDYLNIPILITEPLGLKVGTPMLYGPPLTPHGRKKKPRLGMGFCPFCGEEFKRA